MPIDITWAGQVDLTAYLPIEKPPAKPPIIRIKVYVPSYELQQRDPTDLTPEDLKDWDRTKQGLINQFLKDFHWDGTYVDNKLNRRLDRVGKPKLNLDRLIDVTNDEQLSAVEKTLEAQPAEIRDSILSEALDISENVDELVTNTPTIADEVSTLVKEIETRWALPPAMISPRTGKPISREELRKVREGTLWGAMWFK